MAASLLMADSCFVGWVRRLSKGWSFTATQSSGDSAYSPECVECKFSEVRIQHPALLRLIPRSGAAMPLTPLACRFEPTPARGVPPSMSDMIVYFR
jgi:hypothetical protein